MILPLFPRSLNKENIEHAGFIIFVVIYKLHLCLNSGIRLIEAPNCNEIVLRLAATLRIFLCDVYDIIFRPLIDERPI